MLINQFIRSGTSIGANIRAAFYAHGRADFIAKLQIALKEASETGKWLKCYIKPRALQKNNTNILTDYVLQFGYY